MEVKLENVFQIANTEVEDTLKWAKEDANLNIGRLRELLVYAGKRCDIYLVMSKRYEEYISDQKRQIENSIGYTDILQRWLEILEVGKKANDLIGYLTLLQMDAITSLINILEAKTDTERLVVCKHAYTIIYDVHDKGLFGVVSKEMRNMPEEVLESKYRDVLWKEIKGVMKLMMGKQEVVKVRNSIDAHKSASFTEQIEAYKQCGFGKSCANMYALIKIIDILQETMDLVKRNIEVQEEKLFAETKESEKMFKELLMELEGK